MNIRDYSLGELAEMLGLHISGNPEKIINGVSTPDKASDNQMAFLIEERYYKYLNTSNAAVFLVKEDFPTDSEHNFLITDNPRMTMLRILEIFNFEYQLYEGVHNSAFTGENFSYGKNISINPFVYIGKNVRIGNNVTVMPNCFIGDNTEIADNVFIYPNVSIMAGSLIGNNVKIHSGTVIGSDGYGYIQTDENLHLKMPQIGNVIIEDDVEIGANVSIDKGTISSTLIGEGTKIDNQVHIAHNVQIGKRSLIIAQVGIAGSTKIGRNAIIAGQAGISGHLELGDNLRVYGRSGVTKDFPDNSTVSGFPAKNHKEEIRNRLLLKKIPSLIEEIEILKQRLKYLENHK